MLLIRDGKLLNLESDMKLPTRAAWLTQGDVWWRLDLFFDQMSNEVPENRQYNKWFEFFCGQLRNTSLVDDNNSLESHVYSPKGRVPNTDAVSQDMASSVALARFMFQACFTTRTEAHREWFKTKLNNAMKRVCEGIVAEPLVMHLDQGRVPFTWIIHSTGLVSGFAAWMMKGLHGNTSRSLLDLWEDMFKENKLSSSLRDDESEGRVPQHWEDVRTNIHDIIDFATTAKHHRSMQPSGNGHGLAKTVQEAFRQMHECLSETLSVGLQFYVIHDYMTRYDAGVAVMPRKALLGKRVPLKNAVNIKSIWNLIQGAAKSGTSLRQALILKNQDERSDLHGSSAILCRVFLFILLRISHSLNAFFAALFGIIIMINYYCLRLAVRV